MQLGIFCGQSSWFSWLHLQQIQIFPVIGFWFEVLLAWWVVEDPDLESIVSEVVFVVVVGFMDFVLMVVVFYDGDVCDGLCYRWWSVSWYLTARGLADCILSVR